MTECVRRGEARRRRRYSQGPCIEHKDVREWSITAPVDIGRAAAVPSPSPRWLAEPPRIACSDAKPRCEQVWTRTEPIALLAELISWAASQTHFDCWFEPDFPSNVAKSSGQSSRDATVEDLEAEARPLIIAGSVLFALFGSILCCAACSVIRDKRAERLRTEGEVHTAAAQDGNPRPPLRRSEQEVAMVAMASASAVDVSAKP